MNPEPKETTVSEPDDRLESIRKRAEAATAGPWCRCADGHTTDPLFTTRLWVTHYLPRVNLPTPRALLQPGSREDSRRVALVSEALGCPDIAPQKAADALFIAHAREDVPWLVAEVARLRDIIRRAADSHNGSDSFVPEILAEADA